MKPYCFLLLGGLFLLPAGYLLGNEIQIAGAHSWKSPFGYRSISFGTPSRSGPPDAMGTSVTGERFSGIRLDLNRDLVRLGASLGFNDVTIQTERATVPKLEDLRRWADETGNFKFIKDQGMTISVWVHEFCELPTAWGQNIHPPSIERRTGCVVVNKLGELMAKSKSERHMLTDEFFDPTG